jgi:deoxyadenosine/deoxycytidine kinase
LSSPSAVATVPVALPGDARPILVCVSGQTGAGKSTILRDVGEVIAGMRRNVVILDEKALHHPYLERLFSDPDRFALELQLQFMVSRVLFVKRWLAAGHSIVMERSHLEDPVFIRHLRSFGYVTPAEHDVYMAVWAALGARVPPPDALIQLDVAAEVSIDRLSGAGAMAGRPPFPDSDLQRKWITSWHDLYRRRFEELAADPRYVGRVARFAPPLDSHSVRDFLASALRHDGGAAAEATPIRLT